MVASAIQVGLRYPAAKLLSLWGWGILAQSSWEIAFILQLWFDLLNSQLGKYRLCVAQGSAGWNELQKIQQEALQGDTITYGL